MSVADVVVPSLDVSITQLNSTQLVCLGSVGSRTNAVGSDRSSTWRHSCWQGECGKEAEGQQGLPQRCDRDRQEHHQVPSTRQFSVTNLTAARQCSAALEPSTPRRRRRYKWLPTRRSLPKALILGMERLFALSTSEARCALHSHVPVSTCLMLQGSTCRAPLAGTTASED